ncbi:MAG: HDIG domain-containing protein [Anaerolineae bacterium]|nr:HDIG domain-containing protein [Anaerolineae bacterium]MDW8171781.1 HDIG domain-containing protein [Anaerolineae bacterium]
MLQRFAASLEQRYHVTTEELKRAVRRALAALAALFFIISATLIIAFEDVFFEFGGVAALNAGDIAPRNIIAPQSRAYISEALTREARQNARQAVSPIYDPPDPNIARQQTQLAQQIVNYILNVRRDPYASMEQKISDLSKISALALDEAVIARIASMSDEAWAQVADEITVLLPRLMRESIRPSDLPSQIAQLSNQVSVRFDAQERAIVVAIVRDLLRANTFENVEATEAAREQAARAVAPISRSFARGELIVGAGEVISEVDYEAMQALGVLRPQDLRAQKIIQALLASALTMVIIGLYLVRFTPELVFVHVRTLSLFSALFLAMLAALRLFGIEGNVYFFPHAALGLLFSALHGPHLAIIATLALAFLGGLMADAPYELMSLIMIGGIIAALRLRSAERLNAFFVAGALVAVVNVGIVGLFLLTNPLLDVSSLGLLAMTFFSGAILTPATAIAAMYLVTQLFNLTTPFKLLDLAQANKPLLQRLLREAPGTYQHSLQVANLAEQAATAIGADALLVRVAALYHDIGKMLNPLYFTENQQDIANPHDILNDPYRSAQIIISHVTDGDELARQYRLPSRLRDFIREHHGTTRVYVFYQRALALVDGDTEQVDAALFTYPGPRPHSRETAILMLADSCEATVRGVKPQSKAEIGELVNKVFEEKRQSGQLDRCGLTLNELYMIRAAFTEVLQGMFHPRINYAEAVRKTTLTPAVASPKPEPRSATTEVNALRRPAPALGKPEVAPSLPRLASDDAPLAEVPRLTPKAIPPVPPNSNGAQAPQDERKAESDSL